MVWSIVAAICISAVLPPMGLCVGGCLSDSHGTSIGHSFRRWHCQPDTEADTIAGSDGKTQSGYLFEKCTSGYYINRGGSR